MSVILHPIASLLASPKARHPHLVAVHLLFIAFSSQLNAQFDTAIVPHRYIFVYRNATVPGDASAHAHPAGARLLRRLDRFGMTIIDSSESDDAPMMRRLASMPGVDYVLHDRTVTASRVILAPAIEPTFSVVVNPLPPAQPANPSECLL